MVGERGSSSSSSPSRLSPLAPPFTINRSTRPPNSNLLAQSREHPYASASTPSLHNWHPTSPFTSSVLESFSSPTLESDDSSIGAPLSAYGYLGHHSNDAFAAFPNDHPLETNPYYPQYSSTVFHGNIPLAIHNRSDFDALSTSIATPLDEASRTDYPQDSSGLDYTAQRNGMWNGLSYADQRSFSCKENNSGASSANKSLLKQGVTDAEGSQTCLVTSASWCGKCTGILGRDDQIGSRGTEQIDAEWLSFPVENLNATTSKILTSSVLCSTAIAQKVPEFQVPYLAPLVNSLSHDNTNTASYVRGFSQLYSYTANPTVSHLSETNSCPARVFGSSGGSTTFSVPRPVLSENYISSGNVAVNNNENSSGYTTSSLNGPDVPRNAVGFLVYRDESVMDKGKEIKDYIFVESSSTNKDEFSNKKPVSDDAMDSLLTEKSELRAMHPNLLDDMTSKSHCAERGVSIENSSEMFDKDDSEVDSPCWKGTLARCSPFEVPVNSQLKNELEACKSLNPLAPQFFPGNTKGSLDYRGNECYGADLLAFQKSISSVKSLSEEHGLRDAVEAGSCPSKVSSGVGAQCFDDILEPRKECALLNNSNSTSEINSSRMVKPSVVEDHFRSKGKFVFGANVSGSVNGIKDAAQNGSSFVPFLATEHVSGVPSSGVTVPTEIMETLRDAFNSLSTLSIIDSQIVVNALCILSEFLIQNFSNDLDSLKEQDEDILRHVINNLYLCIGKRGGQRTPVSETPHPSTSYCPRKSTVFHKGTDMEFQVTSTEDVSVPHKLGNQNEHEKQNSFSTVYSESSERDYRVPDSLFSSSGEGIEKGDSKSQVIEEVQIVEDMHPQVLLYKNLWHEAEAALRSLKYKDCVVRMKTKMDKCKSDIKYG